MIIHSFWIFTFLKGNFPLRWMAIESIEELKFTEKTDV